MDWTQRPGTDEYDAYYHTYVSKVPEESLLDALAAERDRTATLLHGLTEEQASFRYAEGKWSLKEVIGHLLDTERVFSYRALCFARNDPGALPGMEQDDWAAVSRVHHRPIGDIAAEFTALRNANISLFGSFNEEEALRRGIASGLEFTARAICFITCGHEVHHVGVIRERYLS